MSAESIHQLVARCIGETVAKAFSLPSDAIERAFAELADEWLPLPRQQWERVEIDRRLAEARVSVLFDRTEGHAQFDRAWEDMQNRGYTDPEREASMLWYRAKNLCLRSDYVRAGEAVARLEQLIDLHMAMDHAEMASHFRQAIVNLALP